jgi:hypothetical protein
MLSSRDSDFCFPAAIVLLGYPFKLLDAMRSWFYGPEIMTRKTVQSPLHGERTMPQSNILRWNENDIAKPEIFQGKLPRAGIAVRIGRRPAALAVKTQLELSLKMKPADSRRNPSNPDSRASGFDWT